MAKKKKEKEEPEDDDDDSGERIIKEISVTPAVTGLLKPTADLLGKEFRDFVQVGIDRLKGKKREENFVEHVKRVQERLQSASGRAESQNELSIAGLVIFSEWAEHVQDVDPADKELSDLWDGLLASVARGEALSIEAMQALKTLTPAEAVMLLEIDDVKLSRDFMALLDKDRERIMFVRNSLHEKGLAARRIDWHVVIPLIGVGLLFVYALMWVNYSGDGGSRRFSDYLWRRIMVFDFPFEFLTLYGGAVVLIATFMKRWRPTWLGKKVVSYAVPRRRTQA